MYTLHDLPEDIVFLPLELDGPSFLYYEHPAELTRIADRVAYLILTGPFESNLDLLYFLRLAYLRSHYLCRTIKEQYILVSVAANLLHNIYGPLSPLASPPTPEEVKDYAIIMIGRACGMFEHRQDNAPAERLTMDDDITIRLHLPISWLSDVPAETPLVWRCLYNIGRA